MSLKLLLLGFVAGFLATLIFHQGLWYLFNQAGIIPLDRPAWATDPIPPFGVPAVLSKAFWGGLWGLALTPVLVHLSGPSYWGRLDLGWRIGPYRCRLFCRAAAEGRADAGGGAPLPYRDGGERRLGLRHGAHLAALRRIAILTELHRSPLVKFPASESRFDVSAAL